MADYPMRRPPEDFFFYPASPTAMIMEEYCSAPADYRSSTWSANASDVHVTPPSDVIQLKPGNKTPEAAATIRDLVDEPIFWRGYTSDEEVASPVVDDSNSFDSESLCYDSDDVVSIHDDAPSPQHSSQSLDKGKQHITHAHAVQFTPAGKAKVVSMPTPVTLRTAPSSPTGPPRASASRMNIQGRAINFSRTITPIASTDGEQDSDADKQHYGYSPDPKKTIRRKPDVPALQTAWRSHGVSAPVTPRSARRAGFIEPAGSAVASPLSEAAWFSQSNTPEEDRPASQMKKPAPRQHRNSEPEPFPAQEASPVPDSPPFPSSHQRSGSYVFGGATSPSRPAPRSTSSQYAREAYTFPDSPSQSRPRLLRKISSTWSFKSFTRPSRRDSFSSNESARLQPVSETTTTMRPPVHAISAMHVPHRTSSKPLPKMVPRGANERAPPIVIPPCPEDYDGEGEDDELPAARWPLTKKDCSSMAAVTEKANGDHPMSPAKTHQRRKSHSTSSGSGSS